MLCFTGINIQTKQVVYDKVLERDKFLLPFFTFIGWFLSFFFTTFLFFSFLFKCYFGLKYAVRTIKIVKQVRKLS